MKHLSEETLIWGSDRAIAGRPRPLHARRAGNCAANRGRSTGDDPER
jgi:hypothetical protein